MSSIRPEGSIVIVITISDLITFQQHDMVSRQARYCWSASWLLMYTNVSEWPQAMCPQFSKLMSTWLTSIEISDTHGQVRKRTRLDQTTMSTTLNLFLAKTLIDALLLNVAKKCGSARVPYEWNDWLIRGSLSSRQHGIGYVKHSCYGHGRLLVAPCVHLLVPAGAHFTGYLNNQWR